MFDLGGRVALVTGGGTGIGFAIARGLGRAGARVVISGRRMARLESALEALTGEGLAAFARPFDVTDPNQVRNAIGAIERHVGSVEILVNNAAMNVRAPLADFAEADWHSMLAANLDGPFHVTRAVLSPMKARRAGRIINICSLASDLGRPNIVPYAVTKGGLKQFTRALAVELARDNIQVNGIAPGFFRTEMNQPLMDDAEFSAWVERRTPAGRWGETDELAGVAVFLASDAASYVTGAIVPVDGGFGAAY